MKKSPEFNFVNEQDKKEFEKIPKGEQEIAMEIFKEENKEESKEKELENKSKFEYYSNNKEAVEAMARAAEALEFPRGTMIDLEYSKENEVDTRKGGNYGELARIIREKVKKEEVPVILSSLSPLKDLTDDVRFYALLAYKKVGFVRVPFELTEVLKLVTKLNDAPNIKDELAEKLSNLRLKQRMAGWIRHSFRDDEKSVVKVNQSFDTNFDSKKDFVEAKEFLDKLVESEELELEKEYKGKELKGVFCDFEGTLVDIKTGELNLEVLKRLDEYDRKEFVHIWTGGDVKKAREFVSKQNRAWLVLPKQDFNGSEPEIVIDDLSEEDFEKQYGIKSQKFINVKDVGR